MPKPSMSLPKAEIISVKILLPVIPLTIGLSFWYAWECLRMSASIELERPYVYRQFVPLAARLISRLTAITVNQAVIVVIVLCALVFTFAAHDLFRLFYPTDPRASRFALVMIGLLFLLAAFPRHTYDIPTGMFFTLALVLIRREHLKLYALLFPLICLNRETAFLLTLLFAVYFYRTLDRRSYWLYLMYQGIVYIVIRVVLTWAFANMPGHPFSFRLIENLERYASGPFTTQIFLLFLVALTFLLVIKWQRAPALMRTAFLVLTPPLVVLYFCFGWSFEVRVFIELLPVIGIISTA